MGSILYSGWLAQCLSGLAGEWATCAWRTLWTGGRHTAWLKMESPAGPSRLSWTRFSTPCGSGFPTACTGSPMTFLSAWRLTLRPSWPTARNCWTDGHGVRTHALRSTCTGHQLHHQHCPTASGWQLQVPAGGASTSTVELVVELEPETYTWALLTQIYNNSAIHICVFRVAPK